MSQDLIIIAPLHWNLEAIQRRLVPNWHLRLFADDGRPELQVHGPNHEWYIRIFDYDRDARLLSEYMAKECVVEDVKKVIRDSVFFAMEFNDFKVCKRFLMDLCGGEDVLIDTLYGEFLTGHELRDHVSADVNYDWRRVRGGQR